jgi:hypothetical protein
MLGLSYHNVRELNEIIDTQFPRPPRFHRQDVRIGGETVSMYSRNVIECIKALYSSAEFAPYMIYRPERHYKWGNGSERHYHDMHTGDWWWEMQVGIHPSPRRHRLWLVTDDFRRAETWRNSCAHFTLVGSNAGHSFRVQNSISSIFDNRKFTEGHPS